MKRFREDAQTIIEASIRAVMPDAAVRRALAAYERPAGKLVLVAVGKAAWQMAHAAAASVAVDEGIVITKYGHVAGEIAHVRCLEAGHPVPDENGFSATEEVLRMVSGLTAEDGVLFLLSGGGSALFEKPLIPADELRAVTERLLAAGADIVEINTIRKRLSAVKGGRFGAACAPARVFSIVLSDIVGDPLDMIASGPACPDSSTAGQALAIADRYDLHLSDRARELLTDELPTSLDHVETVVTGSVRALCQAAASACSKLGYEPVILTDEVTCEATEAGRELGRLARRAAQEIDESGGRHIAYIMGGETVVRVRGRGLGGRNQEIALSAAPLIDGLDAAVFSVGSDGTDGPTDAAGGYVDGKTCALLKKRGIDIGQALADNDSYHALQAVDGLIITGPTGTNVNDVSVALAAIRRNKRTL